MSNPYSGANFFEFFWIYLSRIFTFQELVADEVQLYTLSCIGVASALVGTFLILRKMTMLANALSHTSLIGIVLAYLLFSSQKEMHISLFLTAAILTGVITALLTEFLSKVIKLQEDASISLVFTSLFALGIILVTLYAKESHIGNELIMGNVDALKKEDTYLASLVLGINVLFLLIFFKELKIASFDGFLGKMFGLYPSFFTWALTILTAITTMSAFRAVGVLMVLGFLTAPPLIARCFTHSLVKLMILASLVGVGVSFIGVALSRHILTVCGFGLSTSGITICVMVVFYLLSYFIQSLKEKRKVV